MLKLRTPSVFLSALEQDALVLTPNHQLAVALHETHGKLSVDQGAAAVCPAADIMAVDIWLRRCWEKLSLGSRDRPALLEPRFEKLLWRQVIRQSPDGGTLLNPDAAATAAAEAWTTMQMFGLDQDRFRQWLASGDQAQDDYQDLQAFLDWSGRFAARLEATHHVTLSSCLETIVTGLEADDPVYLSLLPARSLQFGFEDPPPLYQRLLRQLERLTRHDTLALYQGQATIHGWFANSQVQEIRAVADWCQQTLSRTPDASIAVLIPGLHQHSDTVERLFRQYLEPDVFSMPAAGKVDSMPLISSALQLLSLNLDPLNALEVCRTLRTPFLPDEDASVARAALEAHIRNDGELLLSGARLRFLCLQEGRHWYCPELGNRLTSFHECVRRQLSARHSGPAAITLILRQLQALGWPGRAWQEYAAAELEAAFEQWEALLDELAEAIALLGPLPYVEIIALLKQLAASRPLPRQRFGQVRLMSPAEAQYLQFTHTWFMGLDDRRWPESPRFNPLLPFALQRAYGMIPENQGDVARWHDSLVREHIQHQCHALQMSYSRQDDGQEQAPAAIFRELLGKKTAQSIDTPEHSLQAATENLRLASPADALACETEPAALPLDPDESPRGGAAILENQSCCPFRSLALHRLAATELRDPEYGLSPMVTGTMLHRALDHCWGKLEYHRNLMSWSPEALQDLVQEACETALRDVARQHPLLLQGRFRQLELMRLQSLISDWLDEERKRPFARVIDCEKSLTWQHGDLQIRLRLDRVEERLDGSLAIVDYKSGRRKSIRWTDPRPENPQLMLYLVAASQYYSGREITALLFAHVNAQEKRFNGLSLDSDNYPAIDFDRQIGSKTGQSWDDLRSLWQQSIENLASEFIAGECSVTPRNAGICQRCHLQPFCRIGDQARLLDADDTFQEADT